MPRKKGARKEAEKKVRNPEALGIAGFTLGIVSLVMILFSPFLGVVLSIIGLIFCLVQQKKQKTKTARIGIILNGISLILNIAWWILYVTVVYPYFQQSISSLNLSTP